MNDHGLNLHALTDLLEETRQAASAVREAHQPTTDGEPLLGKGSDADGYVMAEAAQPGKLDGLRVDPRALRLDPTAVADRILTAVNAAFTDLHAKQAASVGAPVIDTDALNQQLSQLQEQSTRQMAALGDALNDLLTRVARRN